MSRVVTLEVHQANAYASAPLQVSLHSTDTETGYGHGYRIHGPKFGGAQSERVLQVVVTPEMARQMLPYIEAAFPAPSSSPEGVRDA